MPGIHNRYHAQLLRCAFAKTGSSLHRVLMLARRTWRLPDRLAPASAVGERRGKHAGFQAGPHVTKTPIIGVKKPIKGDRSARSTAESPRHCPSNGTSHSIAL